MGSSDERIKKALSLAYNYGGCESSQNKAWLIDQIVRSLTGNRYDEWVKEFSIDNNGNKSYKWDTGVSPECDATAI